MTQGTQVEVTDLVREKAEEFGAISTPSDLSRLRSFIFQNLKVLPYDREAEALMRWRRTGSEILEDGYVYDTKYCTDIVIVFLTLCLAKGLYARFVKLTREGGATHSIAEVKLPEGWFWYDVSISTNPFPGEVDETWDYKGWIIRGKGRDAWELGYKGFLETKRFD